MDTTQYKELTLEEYKRHTRSHWSKQPCGSHYSEKISPTKEYFEKVEAHRYSTHPFILPAIRSFDIRDKRVLEIGFGMGTDYVNFASQGALMYGLDMTPRHVEITAQRLALHGFESRLLVGEAESLPYPNDTFDFVYSFGVIHHSPHTDQIVREMRRVLKPGGNCWVCVYHKNSLFFWWSIFCIHHVLLGGFLRESLKSRLSRIEYPNDNPNLVVRLYTKRELTDLFSREGFRDITTHVDHIEPRHISVFGRFLSRRVLEPFANRYGWYVIAQGQK